MFRFNDGRDWFLRRRLGLFLHWGLYAINGIQEQEQQRCGVPADEYRKLIGKFNPRRFDPDVVRHTDIERCDVLHAVWLAAA